jgi:hypothetical protein
MSNLLQRFTKIVDQDFEAIARYHGVVIGEELPLTWLRKCF